MLGPQYHAYPVGTEVLGEPARQLGGQPLLHLRSAREVLHHPRQLRPASAVARLGGMGVELGAVVVLGGTVATGLPATAVGVAQAVAGAAVAMLSISVLPYAFREASRPVAVVATAGLALGYVLGGVTGSAAHACAARWFPWLEEGHLAPTSASRAERQPTTPMISWTSITLVTASSASRVA